MFKYKINVLQVLKDKGYNQTVIARTNIISQSALCKIRSGEVVGIIVLDKLCSLLDCNIEDLIEHVKE